MYLIIIKTIIHIPGDERSKRSPGHGYPAHDKTCYDVEKFVDKNLFENRIKQLINRETIFEAYEVNELKIRSETVITYQKKINP